MDWGIGKIWTGTVDFVKDTTKGAAKVATKTVDLACDTAKGAVNIAQNVASAPVSLMSGDSKKALQNLKDAGKGVTDTVGNSLNGTVNLAATEVDTVKNAGAAVGTVFSGTADLMTAGLDTIQKGAHAADEFISGNNTATQEPAKAETQTSVPTTTASTETTEPPETPIEVIQTTEMPPMFETAPTTIASTETTEPPETPIEVIQTTETAPMFETASKTTAAADPTEPPETPIEPIEPIEKAEEARNAEEQPTTTAGQNKLILDTVETFNEAGELGAQVLNNNKDNSYYRSDNVFGNMRKSTQATEEVEDVVAYVIDELDSPTARDAQAYDIAAKSAGVGGFKDMFGKGKGTDAYKMFLDVNNDDFTLRETEYKGKKETKAYLDKDKSDGEITLFGSELVNGKELLTMRDKEGKVHYFDLKNYGSEVQVD